MFYLAEEEPPAVTLQDEEVSGADWLAMSEVTSPTLRAKLLDAGLVMPTPAPTPVKDSAHGS
ncbi:hypothetical protein GCM10010521_55890 [Streptomyces rameus]|uniref:Uncharacterized protein n=1 Tax=Streptomyces rameus TaxID=68261 RepID=A0ABP6HEQ0_9ACTN